MEMHRLAKRHVMKDHDIVLTHGDFDPRNILVQGDEAVAILDSEMSGYIPLTGNMERLCYGRSGRVRGAVARLWTKFWNRFTMRSQSCGLQMTFCTDGTNILRISHILSLVQTVALTGSQRTFRAMKLQMSSISSWILYQSPWSL
jgi:hypothetical protein